MSKKIAAVLTALSFVFAAAASGQQVKVAEVEILPPEIDRKPRLTNGQIAVGAKEVFNTPLNGSMVSALKEARTRAEQEEAVLRFISPELRKKFEEMNEVEPDLFKPEEITPTTSEGEAFKLAVYKQSFTPFAVWGSSPFGKPARTWQELREYFGDYMDSVIERTSYSPEMKAHWYDELHKCLQNGPDGRFCKEVNVQDWPLWQWTTGRTAVVTRGDSMPGVNVKYTGAPAKALWVALPRFGMAIMHGYECRGNPIVPYVGDTTFRMQKTENEPREPRVPEQCKCSILTAEGNRDRQEIFPDQNVELEAHILGLTDQLRVEKEMWYVNGEPKLGNQRTFAFKPSDFNFQPETYRIEFRLDDQFGRTTICPFMVVIKSRVSSEPPPTQTTHLNVPTGKTVPCPTCPRVEKGKGRCGTACKALIIAGIAGGAIGACAAIGCFGGHKNPPTAIVPTKPATPAIGVASVGGIRISFGSGRTSVR